MIRCVTLGPGMDVMLIGMTTREKSCFNDVIVLALDTLMSAVEDRFYHVR